MHLATGRSRTVVLVLTLTRCTKLSLPGITSITPANGQQLCGVVSSATSTIIGVREIFCQVGGGGEGGGGKPFAQKYLAGCPNFYERVGRRGGPYYNNIGRTGIYMKMA